MQTASVDCPRGSLGHGKKRQRLRTLCCLICFASGGHGFLKHRIHRLLGRVGAED